MRAPVRPNLTGWGRKRDRELHSRSPVSGSRFLTEDGGPDLRGSWGRGLRSGPCSQRGSRAASILLLFPVSTTLIVSNAALQRDAARHVRVMSVLFKAGE